MIKQNKFEFGYGDIAVGSNSLGYISFQSFKPPSQIGIFVPKDVEFYDDEVVLKISCDECFELVKLLNNIKNNEVKTFIYKNYEFDFTNYNEKSINVCLKHVKNAMKCELLTYAC